MKENITLIIAVSLIILNIVIAYILKYNKSKIIVSQYKKIWYVTMGLAVILIIYDATETIHDCIHVVCILSSVITLGYIYDNKHKERHWQIVVRHFLTWIIMFFIIKWVNTYMVFPLGHIPWIVALGFNMFIHSIRKNSEKMALLCIASNCLALIALVLLFHHFSEPLKGISKQEIVVRKYLIAHNSYTENEDIKLRRLSSKEGQQRVFVKIKEGAYIYHYNQGKIQEIVKLQ